MPDSGCCVEVTRVVAHPDSSGNVHSIIVQGTSTGCPLNDAYAAPDGTQMARIFVKVKRGNDTRSGVTHLSSEENQEWWVDVRGIQAQCGDEVIVSAWCGEENSDCGVAELPLVIECPSCPLPDFTVSMDPMVCDGEGSRRITITANFNPSDLAALGVNLEFFSPNVLWFHQNEVVYNGDLDADGTSVAEIYLSESDHAASDTVFFELSSDCRYPIEIQDYTPCPTPCPKSPPEGDVVLRVKPANWGPLSDVFQWGDCLPAGFYRVEVVGSNLYESSFSWEVDNNEAVGETGDFILVDLVDADKSISVTVTPPAGCDPFDLTIDLPLCPADCPEIARLKITDNFQNDVTDLNCIPTGNYIVEVVGEHLQVADFVWNVNGNPAGSGLQIAVFVDSDKHVTLHVTQAGCDIPPLSRDLILCATTMTCPRLDSLDVYDSQGVGPKDLHECLPEGDYRVVPEGANLDPGRNISEGLHTWEINDHPVEDASGATVTENGLELYLERDQTVSLKIQKGVCDDQNKSIQLRVCEPIIILEQLEIEPLEPNSIDWCYLLYIVGLGFLILGLVLIWGGMCSANIAVAIGGGASAALGFALLVTWMLFCAAANNLGCTQLAGLFHILGAIQALLLTVGGIFGIITLVCGYITAPTGILEILCGLPAACWLGAAIDFGIVGALMIVLGEIMINKCFLREG